MGGASDGESNLPQRAVAAGVGGLAGAAVGGPVGAVVGAAGGVALEPLIERMWAEVSADGRRRGVYVVETAARIAGDDPEGFAVKMGATEESRLLAGTAISAATRTTYQPKLLALARVLAAGVENEAPQVDEEQLFIAALADLEAPHVLLLDVLARYVPRLQRSESGVALVAEPSSGSATRRPAWNTSQLTAARPQLESVLPGLLGTLQRHGLCAPSDSLAKAFEAYGKEVAREERTQSRRRQDAVLPVSKAPSKIKLNKLAPEVSWSATEHGVRLLRYLADEEPEASPIL